MKRGKNEPNRKRKLNEIWVTYGQTRSTGVEFEFDRLEVGIATDILPGEDPEEVKIEELDKLKDFVRAYMKGVI